MHAGVVLAKSQYGSGLGNNSMRLLKRNCPFWRHIGKGTFVGGKPARDRNSLAAAAINTNPLEVLDTRLILEPALARLADASG